MLRVPNNLYAHNGAAFTPAPLSFSGMFAITLYHLTSDSFSCPSEISEWHPICRSDLYVKTFTWHTPSWKTFPTKLFESYYILDNINILIPILIAVLLFILYCFCYILCIIQNECKHNRVYPATAIASEVWPLLGNLNPHSASGHFRLTGGIHWCGSTLLSINEG